MEGDEIAFEASAHTRDGGAGRPCVTLLHIEADGLDLNDARALEAEQIALKIRELVDGGGRCSYKDISVLFRAMTNVHLYEQALQEAGGVPYVNLSGRGGFTHAAKFRMSLIIFAGCRTEVMRWLAWPFCGRLLSNLGSRAILAAAGAAGYAFNSGKTGL